MLFAQANWPAAAESGGGTDLNDAENLVSLITEADRSGQAQMLADVYIASQLKQVRHESVYESVYCDDHLRAGFKLIFNK